MLLDETNELFRLAVELVNQSNRNIFVTGKAGTGKTTFLRYVREHSLKQTAVVAPTGVAAINAGGATIHSFFQLPLTPFLPENSGIMIHAANNKQSLLGRMKVNRDRIKLFQQLELLIIDEVSMVRCDLLDSIDVVLRYFRHRHNEPFGGVQVLFIGDLFQLPPVAIDQEWQLLSQYYSSPYFFASKVIRESPLLHITFEKIYRQQDDRFIEVLNQVRNNALSKEGLKLLESRYQPPHLVSNNSGILLTTHNHKAEAVNRERLTALPAKTHVFKASIEGDFNEKAYPADELLSLKEGAQVMFIRNDKERVKRYFNGKIGIVSSITDEAVFVQCPGDEQPIEVQKEKWENIRYSINRSNNQLEEDVLGSFTQYPLRLAWAITIHKSQGLTFEKAVIDAGAAFAAGQVYVALSRCTNLEGITLTSPLVANQLQTDEAIVAFTRQAQDATTLATAVQTAKQEYQQQLLLNLFDFSGLLRSYRSVEELVKGGDFGDQAEPWLQEIKQQLQELQSVGEKYCARLRYFFGQAILPETYTPLQDRTRDAATFFSKALHSLLQLVQQSPVITDSKTQSREFNAICKDFFTSVAEKHHLIKGLIHGFSVERYHHQKKHFKVPSFLVDSYAALRKQYDTTLHPELHQQLQELRNELCAQHRLPVAKVASTAAIKEMVLYLPQTKAALKHITGFGKATIERFGEDFLKRIRNYCELHHIAEASEPPPSKITRRKREPKSGKPDTRSVSYEMFREGHSIESIAAARQLTTGTIEAHLAGYVSQGLIPVESLVSKEMMNMIAPVLQEYDGGPLTPIIQQLEHKVSYGALRLAIAAREWQMRACS